MAGLESDRTFDPTTSKFYIGWLPIGSESTCRHRFMFRSHQPGCWLPGTLFLNSNTSKSHSNHPLQILNWKRGSTPPFSSKTIFNTVSNSISLATTIFPFILWHVDCHCDDGDNFSFVLSWSYVRPAKFSQHQHLQHPWRWSTPSSLHLKSFWCAFGAVPQYLTPLLCIISMIFTLDPWPTLLRKQDNTHCIDWTLGPCIYQRIYFRMGIWEAR